MGQRLNTEGQSYEIHFQKALGKSFIILDLVIPTAQEINYIKIKTIFVLKDMFQSEKNKTMCKPCIWQSITTHTLKQAGKIAQVVKILATSLAT